MSLVSIYLRSSNKDVTVKPEVFKTGKLGFCTIKAASVKLNGNFCVIDIGRVSYSKALPAVVKKKNENNNNQPYPKLFSIMYFFLPQNYL